MSKYIDRKLQKEIEQNLKPGFVIVLVGARRTGKTFLMNSVKAKLSDKKVLHVQGDDMDISEILSSQKIEILKRFVKGYQYLFIDEAQDIPNIGKSLKLIVDMIPDISVFITGSSAFNLQSETGAPLVGRSFFYEMYPFSLSELNNDFLDTKNKLGERLIYGMYPQIILEDDHNRKQQILTSLKNGNLLKDILRIDNLKNSLFVLDLLRLIAFQIGNDISFSELASQLKVNQRTVQRYLDLLEKTYIIFSLRGFSRNLRKEITKSKRYYFWDNGIRNVVISNFNELKNRDDLGKLWENFCISERIKYHKFNMLFPNYFFWRTYDQQEIDLIEEYNGKLNAFEFKYSTTKKAKVPKAFINTYKESEFKVINPDNYFDFLGI